MAGKNLVGTKWLLRDFDAKIMEIMISSDTSELLFFNFRHFAPRF